MKKLLRATTIFIVATMGIFSQACAEELLPIATGTDAEVATGTDATAETQNDITLSYNYIDNGERIDYYIPTNSEQALYSSSIPASFDARNEGYMTSVGDQNPYGTCWAFSALGAGQASMLARGVLSDTTNLDWSEYHLAYFFYNYVNDPLNNLSGDITYPLYDNYLENGGNHYYTTFALATWKGAADETKAPYAEANGSSTLNNSIAYDDVAHLQNSYIISMQNTSEIKKLIMEHGAVASSMYFDTYYYNGSTEAYYQNVTTTTNHAIMIVGWDDNYLPSNFNSSRNLPTNKGAWLIRNSWGDYIDYFWVSYEDLSISNNDAFVYVFDKSDNYDYNYQYDGTYSSYYYSIYNGDSLANVFETTGSNVEEIQAVSFALRSSNVNYSIQIYKNPTDGNPLSGDAMLTTPQEGTTTYAGYYTIELDEDIYIDQGDTFAVVVTVSSTNADTVSFFFDADTSSSWVKFDSTTNEGESFYISNTGNIQDIYNDWNGKNYGYCPRIKAFTSTSDMLCASPETTYEGIDYSKVYNFEYYVNNYPDICAQLEYDDNAILEHFVTEGIPSGQQGIDSFDVYSYAYSYSDLRHAYKNNLKSYYLHYINYGCKEGRIAVGITTMQDGATVYNGKNYSSVFDAEYYRTNNPDIATYYGLDDAAMLSHFVNYGMKEGRQASSNFNVYSYAYAYSDLRNAYKNNLKSYYIHYMNYGHKEGRIAIGTTTMQNGATVYNGKNYSSVYNAEYYRSNNSDVKKTYGLDDVAMLGHFVNYGINEGRQGNSTFNVYSYAYAYSDLRNAYKNNLKSYYLHYINYGCKEGRIAIGTAAIQGGVTVYNGVDYSSVYNLSYYLNNNSDLRSVYGLDDSLYLKHFVGYGMHEGRTAISGFNVYNYKNRYEDLRNVYGNSLGKYYIHYMYYGRYEGRIGY